MSPSPRGRRLPALLAVGVLTACASATPTPKPACPTSAPAPDSAEALVGDTTAVEVRTNKGAFTIQLEPDPAPIAAANFVTLAECGFYDGISFHRVISGFVIQAGDPGTRTNRGDFAGLGTGGPGYRFVIEPPAADQSYDPYVVAMANSSQPDSNGSQFFVNLADLDQQLTRTYTILGTVTQGLEVVDAIGSVPTTGDPLNIPLDPVIIETMVLVGAPESS